MASVRSGCLPLLLASLARSARLAGLTSLTLSLPSYRYSPAIKN